MQRALITGASGFLGGRLAQVLVERDIPTRIIIRPTSGIDHLSGLPLAGLSLAGLSLAGLSLEVLRAELSDPNALLTAMRDVSHIFHCAGCSTDWAPAPAYYEANVQATQALLFAARTALTQGAPIERFVHVSSTDVYGYPRVPCDESHPLTFVGLPYNETKCLGEAAASEAWEKAGLPVTILRPATIYGPRGTAFVTDIVRLLEDKSMALFDGGRSRGGFCYVDNVVDAMIAAATHPATIGNAYNLSDATNLTWKQYVSALADGLALKQPWIQLPSALALQVGHAMELAYKLLPLPGRPLLTRHAVLLLSRDQEYPVDRARRDFGLSPNVSFAQGMERSIDWARREVLSSR